MKESWPSDWQTRVLDSAGIPDTLFARTAIMAWNHSTPLQPWSNNPLGMPQKPYSNVTVLDTPYAAFSSITAFIAAFVKFLATKDGIKVRDALNGEKGYGPVWRAVSQLGWPASRTETDWPSALLDIAERRYAESVKASPAGSRKSAGKTPSPATAHEAMALQNKVMVEAAHNFSDAAKAVRHVIRRLG